VAKGLLRSEITYAKEMTEIVVRPMFMKIIEWKIGVENDFSVSFGKAGRFMRKYLSENFYNKILKTYSNDKFEDNWKSLFVMADIFRQTSNQIANELGFQINRNNQNNTMEYLKQEYYRQNLREER
jgi:aminoglycoside 6-adenylyltransferase